MTRRKNAPHEPAPRTWVYTGDCADVMAAELEPESIDAIVSDPPYGIGFMGKDFDNLGEGGDQQAFHRRWAEAAIRVLKPGGYVLAMGSPRTYHHLAYGLELAGFEIRDSIHWIYGSGFPKSLDCGGGLGTALKPAHEPILVARKPFPGTVAQNLEEHGTGAINVEACRVGVEPVTINRYDAGGDPFLGHREDSRGMNGETYEPHESIGRWPPNVILAHVEGCGIRCVEGCPVAEMDRQSGYTVSRSGGIAGWQTGGYVGGVPGPDVERICPEDSGGASRYFPIFKYKAKPGREEREAGCWDLEGRNWSDGRKGIANHPKLRDARSRGNHHPTVKPLDLMRWLLALVVPDGGIVLDPFLGSGSTLCAAVLEQVDAIGIEMDPAYVEIALARIRYWASTDDARQMGLGI
jgi:site-specific DNA-methyltransferase (adenine-specific)